MYRMLKAVNASRSHVVVSDRIMDWDLIEELVSALADVAQLTIEMQSHVYMMGDFYRDLWLCRDRLNSIYPSSGCIEALLDRLEQRTSVLVSTVTFAAGIVCDPRFNTANYKAIDERQRNEAIVSCCFHLIISFTIYLNFSSTNSIIIFFFSCFTNSTSWHENTSSFNELKRAITRKSMNSTCPEHR